MKSILYCVVVFATLLFSASCQKETLGQEGTDVVSYTVRIPDVITTKATVYNGVNELVYEVYNADNEKRLYQKKAEIIGGTAQIEFEVVNNQNTLILFWAQYANNQLYNTADLKHVTLNSSENVKANQKDYEAFTGKDYIQKGEALNGRSIELKRPIAMLNLATSEESLVMGDKNGVYTGIVISESNLKVTGLSNTYNVATMSAAAVDPENPTTFEYRMSDYDCFAGGDLDVDGKKYFNVSKNYIGFAPSSGAIVSVACTLKTNVGTISNNIPNIPVKPNYIINVTSNFVTAKTNYHVTFDNNWSSDVLTVEDGIRKNTDGSYTITKPYGLAYASSNLFAAGGTFYIADDIDMTAMNFVPADIPGGVELTIIGGMQTKAEAINPITISGLKVVADNAALIKKVSGKVTIKGIKLTDSEFTSNSGDGSAAALVAKADGEVNIEACVVSRCKISNTNGAAGGLVGNATGSLNISTSEVSRSEIQGGTECTGSIVGTVGDNTTVAIDANNNAYFNTNTSGDEISAVGNKADMVVTSRPDIVNADGAYEVSDLQSFTWAFESADPEAGQVNIKLMDHITLPSALTVPEAKFIVLDLNGKTLSTSYEDESNGKHYYALINNGTLTIKDTETNGKIVSRGNRNYGTFILESGSLQACDGDGGYGIRNYNGSAFNMNGGSVVTTLEDDNQVDKGGYDATPIRVDEGAVATITNGVVNNICDYTFAIENYGNLTVSGGEFTSVHTTVGNIGNSGCMTLNGGEFICNGKEGVTSHTVFADQFSNTVIDGGVYNGKDNNNGYNVYAAGNATVSIYRGNFLYAYSGSLYGEAIVVTGGEFFDNPEKYLADGFTSYKEGEVWKVFNPVSTGISNAAQMFAFARMVNAGNSFKDNTILLTEDIDLNNQEWTPIGLNGKRFMGVFDGQSKTIRNLQITTAENGPQAALFGDVNQATIKNLIVTGAKILYPADYNGDFYAAAVVSQAYMINLENISVSNSTIQGNNKVAAILAQDADAAAMVITDCHVGNCLIQTKNETDGGNAAGIVGSVQGSSKTKTLSKCSVKNTIFNVCNSTDSGKRSNAQMVATIIATEDTVLTLSDCVLEGNTFNQTGVGSYKSPYDGEFVGGSRTEITGKVIINGQEYPLKDQDDTTAINL